MERRRLGVADEVGDLGDRQGRIGKVAPGCAFAGVFEQRLICD
jgi:hypothetical protein